MKNNKAQIFNLSGRQLILTKKLTHQMLKIYLIIYLCLLLLLCLLLFPVLYSLSLNQAKSTSSQLCNIFSDIQTKPLEYAEGLTTLPQLGELLSAFERDPSQSNHALLELYLQSYASTYDDLLLIMINDHNGKLFRSINYQNTKAEQWVLDNKDYNALLSAPSGTLYFPVMDDLFNNIDSGNSYADFPVSALAKNYQIASQVYTLTLYCRVDTELSSAGIIGAGSFDSWGVQCQDCIYYMNNDAPVFNNVLLDRITQQTSASGHLILNSGIVFFNKIFNSNSVMTGYASWKTLMSQFISIILIVTLLYLLSPILYSLFLVRTLNKMLTPLKNLSDAILSYTSGHDATVQIHSGDELEYLGNSFNDMMCKIKAHIEDEKKFERENAVTQFRLLSTQIDPHFIYNTMNIINILARRGATKEVIDVNSALTHILQRRLNTKIRIFDTLEAELETLRQYLLIMDYRYANNVTLHYDIDENVLQERILKNILQPLVENAYFHGLSQDEGNIDGNINLSVHRFEQRIVLTVCDDGRGMSPNRLEQLVHGSGPISDGAKMHVGLYNIRLRLQLIYKKSQTMEIISNLGQGTTVRITFPILPETDREIDAWIWQESLFPSDAPRETL